MQRWEDWYDYRLLKKGMTVWKERDGEIYYNLWEDKLVYAIRYHRLLTEMIAGVIAWILAVILGSVAIFLIEM